MFIGKVANVQRQQQRQQQWEEEKKTAAVATPNLYTDIELWHR